MVENNDKLYILRLPDGEIKLDWNHEINFIIDSLELIGREWGMERVTPLGI